MKTTTYISYWILTVSVLALTACSSSDNQNIPTTAITGSVLAGPTSGAKITVKTITGTIIAGPVTSGSDGSYTIAIPETALAADLIFEASDGTFDDEAEQSSSGKNVPLGTLSAHISGGSLISGAHVTIDPASTIIRKLVAGGKSKTAAESTFNSAFGYIPDSSVRPAFVNMSSASTNKQRLAGIRIAAFSQLTKDLINDPTKQFEMIEALGDDLSDDVLDGKKSGVLVSTATGTVIPEDIDNRFTTALVGFQTSTLNKTKLTPDKIGAIPFKKLALTTNYKVEYIPGSQTATMGRTSFTIKLTNRSDGTPAIGKAVTLLPYMYMATKSHTTPSDTVSDNGDGTYSCNVYFVMASMSNGMSMGIWQLKVSIGTESVYFYPNVAAMPAGTTTLTKLTGISDFIAGAAVPEKRTYFLFRDALTESGGAYTFGFFLATKENMMSFPKVLTGGQLKDQNGAFWTVNSIAVEVSTDAATWFNATDSGNGHWSVAGLTGLSSGVSGKIYVKLTVNGEQKTTDGVAVVAGGTNGYQTFTVIP